MSKLDQSLDSIIEGEGKSSRGTGRTRGRGRGRGRGRSTSASFSEPSNPLSRNEEEEDTGPDRRERFTRKSRAGPYDREENERAFEAGDSDESEWKHDMYRGSNGTDAGSNGRSFGGARIEPGSKVLVSGLDSDVSGDDLKEIFAQVGNISKAVVHYDQNAKSLGTAEVTFSTTASAAKAVKEYDGAEVDGKPMYVKLVGAVVSIPRVVKKPNRDFRGSGKESFFGSSMNDDYEHRPRTRGRGGRARGTSRPTRGRGAGRGRGRGRGGRSEGGGSGKQNKAETSQVDLDAELEAYQKARGGSTASTATTVASGQPASS